MDERTEQLRNDVNDDFDEKNSKNNNDEIRQAARSRAEKYYNDKKLADAEKRTIIFKKTFGVMSIIGCGLLLIISSLQKISIIDYIYFNGQIISGFIIIAVAAIYITAPNVFSVANFRDVDLRRREKTVLAPAAAWPFSVGTSATYEEDEGGDEEDVNDKEADQFKNYFINISELLQERAFDAEEKASLLLDKGSNYTLAGIVFFIVSIVSWQILAWIHGFKIEFIYGIASCSGLFIFIEVLSGWYLKQYRHYVDSATYLLKIKSMFDKFMLAYLSQHSLLDDDLTGRRLANKTLLSMLEKEIRWPNAYMLKRADANFAIEAVETLSKLSKHISKKKKKEKKSKEEKE